MVLLLRRSRRDVQDELLEDLFRQLRQNERVVKDAAADEVLRFIEVELVRYLKHFDCFQGAELIFRDVHVQVFEKQFYGLNNIPGGQKVLSLEDLTGPNGRQPRLQLTRTLQDEREALQRIGMQRLLLLRDVEDALLLSQCPLLVLEAYQVQGVDVYWVVLEFDSQDVDEEDDLAVA